MSEQVEAGPRRCAEGCHWVSHKVPDAPVWVRICSLCGTIDGNDLRMQIDEMLTALREKLEAEHPEARCRRCHTPNSTDWSAPSPLWNQVMRDGDINGGPEAYSGIVCPTCFMVLAQGLGIASRWRLTAERVHVPLQTVTPSGRVWNEQTWLWDDLAVTPVSDDMHLAAALDHVRLGVTRAQASDEIRAAADRLRPLLDIPGVVDYDRGVAEALVRWLDQSAESPSASALRSAQIINGGAVNP